MSLEELWEIKAAISADIKNMSLKEMNEYFKKSSDSLKNRAGKDNFVPTDNPSVWKHIAKKTNTL